MAQSWKLIATRKLKSIKNQYLPGSELSDAEIQQFLNSNQDLRGVNAQFLDKQSLEITNLSAYQRWKELQSRQLTAEKSTIAALKSIAVGDQINGNVLGICAEQALEQARELDKVSSIKPLHGMPVTLKDQFHVSGMDTTIGFLGFVDKPAEGDQESVLPKILRSLGAVIIAKTTLPQGAASPETTNNIRGTNMNPYNKRLTSGGSSGGQAALQALRGCPLGFGTDLGGSVIVPAAYNGLYSIVPSFTHVWDTDIVGRDTHQPLLPMQVGVFSDSIEMIGLTIAKMKAVEHCYGDFNVMEDYRTHEEDLVSDEASDNIAIAVYGEDAQVTFHPPVQRAIRIVLAALSEANICTVPWMPKFHDRCHTIFRRIRASEGNEEHFNAIKLSGEPPIDDLGIDLAVPPNPPAESFKELAQELQDVRQSFIREWDTTASQTRTGRPVNAVILPVAPHTAAPMGHDFGGLGTLATTLGVSRMTLPITTAERRQDRKPEKWQPKSVHDETIWSSYDPDTFDGAPVGVQLWCLPGAEEKILSIAKVVDASLKTWKSKNAE